VEDLEKFTKFFISSALMVLILSNIFPKRLSMLEDDNLFMKVYIIETIVKIIRRVNDLLTPLLVKNEYLLLLVLLEALSSTSNTSMTDVKIVHCELRTRHIYLLRDIFFPLPSKSRSCKFSPLA
jgi:hypothetical protein